MSPPTEEDWKIIEQGFRTRWNLPNCCGALDGKHIAFRQPANTGSLFHNNKHHFSVVLMALVDDQYRFTYIDVGNYGSNSDSDIFRHSNFARKFLARDLNLPPHNTLPALLKLVCYHTVSQQMVQFHWDLAYWSQEAKGYKLPEDQLVLNYWLSHARHIVENAFGILVQHWRVFDRRMYLSTPNATSYTSSYSSTLQKETQMLTISWQNSTLMTQSTTL